MDLGTSVHLRGTKAPRASSRQGYCKQPVPVSRKWRWIVKSGEALAVPHSQSVTGAPRDCTWEQEEPLELRVFLHEPLPQPSWGDHSNNSSGLALTHFITLAGNHAPNPNVGSSRDGLIVKREHCSSRGPKCNSQHLCWVAHTQI